MRTRSVVIARPIVYPACCVSCAAVESSSRSFFVDLGFDISHLFDAQPEGVVYLCDVCMLDYVQIFMKIIEERRLTLEGVYFGRTRTDPVFDRHRELIESLQQRTDEDDNDSDSPDGTVLTANFGG